MISDIFTVTLNPVIDIHYTFDSLTLGTENFATERIKVAAGKGVNLSRALLRRGYIAPAYMLLGAQNGVEYIHLLERDNIPCKFIMVPGRVREYVSLNCPAQKAETRICMKDFTARDSDVAELGRMLLREVKSGSYVALSGSLPAGITFEAFAQLCAQLKEAGAKLIIDCASLSFEQLRTLRPWLIKPNRDETRALLRSAGLPQLENASGEEMALALAEHFEQVIVSLGKEGLVYAGTFYEGGRKVLAKPAIPIKVYSTVGAGDSLIAGFLYSILQKPGDLQAALNTALEYAAETCSRPMD